MRGNSARHTSTLLSFSHVMLTYAVDVVQDSVIRPEAKRRETSVQEAITDHVGLLAMPANRSMMVVV